MKWELSSKLPRGLGETWERYAAERCDASTTVVPREQDHGVSR